MTRRSPRTEQSGSPPLLSRRSPAKNSFSTFVGALRPCSSATVSTRRATESRGTAVCNTAHVHCPRGCSQSAPPLKTMPHVSPKDHFSPRKSSQTMYSGEHHAKAPPALVALQISVHAESNQITSFKPLVKHHHAMPRRTDASLMSRSSVVCPRTARQQAARGWGLRRSAAPPLHSRASPAGYAQKDSSRRAPF